MFQRYMEYTKSEALEIRDFPGRKAGKATRHGDVQQRLRLPGGQKHEVVVRNVLHVKGALNSLSQSRLMDRGLPIVPVNGYGINIYNKLLAEDSARGRGSLVDVACQFGRLFRLDVTCVNVKVAAKRY